MTSKGKNQNQVTKKKHGFLVGFAILLLAGSIYCYWDTNNIQVERFEYISPKVPQEYNGFTIVQISDLHNKKFGAKQEILLDKINFLEPDAIFVTGDLIDRRHYDLDAAMVFIKGAVKIAPVYYVSGNHEAWSGHYMNIKKKLTEAGVIILDDRKVALTKAGYSISLYGLSDPDFSTKTYREGTNTTKVKKLLKAWQKDQHFKILLSHRPELISMYAYTNMDLVFSGHAHGGQLRLPIIGPIVAPDQKIFPKYTDGKYVKKQTTMFVSRGLGNSLIPFRFLNRPEILVVTLGTK
jgi:uncharacterized protein